MSEVDAAHPAAHPVAHAAVRSPEHPGRRSPARTVVRLTVRLTRRSVLFTALALGVYALVEVLVMEQTYPDAASKAALQAVGDFPALRVLQGVPYSVETGALVVWDSGWFVAIITGVWAVTTTSRVLRGDEDEGRSEVMLAGRLRATHMLAWQVLVLTGAACVLGLAVAAGIAAGGAPTTGSVLYGAIVAGFGAAYVTLAAVAAQVFASRTRALGVSATLLGAALVLRMVANSADSRSWLAWVTPLGWPDQVRPFADDRAIILLLPAVVAAGLAGCALALRSGRDSRAGYVRERGERASRAWGLASPIAFAWRSNLGVLVAWAVGLTVWGLAAGALLPSMNDFIESDQSYRDIMAAMGIDLSDLSNAFVGMMATIVGVALAVYASWRIGAARTEESSTRLDTLASRPVLRWRWLGGHVLLALVSVVLLAVLTGAATWVGAAALGSDLAIGDSVVAVLNTVPAVVLFGGLAVLVLGIAPRATVVVPAAAAVVAYVLTFVGPALDWPRPVIDLSPFSHLAAVPAADVAVVPAVVMVVLGLVATAVGVVVFERRDLVGA